MRPKPIEIVGELPEGARVTVEPGAHQYRSCGYVRVSSREESRQTLSPETQRQVIRQYAKLHALEPVQIMEERGSAGTIRRRPVLLQILEMCRGGQVKHVIVQDTTRLFREVREALNVFFEMEESHGVSFHSATEIGPATDTPEGRLMRNQRLIYGQYEREVIGQRTRRVLQATKRVPEADKDLNPAMRDYYDKGKILAGSPPFGYRWRTFKNQHGPNRTILEPCPVNHPIAQRILTLKAEGLDSKAITMKLLGEGVRCRKWKKHGQVVRYATVREVVKRGWV